MNKKILMIIITIIAVTVVGTAVSFAWINNTKPFGMDVSSLDKSSSDQEIIESLITKRNEKLDSFASKFPHEKIYAILYLNNYVPADEISHLFKKYDIELIGLYEGWGEHSGTWAPSRPNMSFDETIEELETELGKFLPLLTRSMFESKPENLTLEAWERYKKSIEKNKQYLADFREYGARLFALEINGKVIDLISIREDKSFQSIIKGIIPENEKSEITPFTPYWEKNYNQESRVQNSTLEESHCDVSNHDWLPGYGYFSVDQHVAFNQFIFTSTNYGSFDTYEHETLIYDMAYAEPKYPWPYGCFSNLPSYYRDVRWCDFQDNLDNYTVGSCDASSILAGPTYYTRYLLEPEIEPEPCVLAEIRGQKGSQMTCPYFCHPVCVFSCDQLGETGGTVTLNLFSAPIEWGYWQRNDIPDTPTPNPSIPTFTPTPVPQSTPTPIPVYRCEYVSQNPNTVFQIWPNKLATFEINYRNTGNRTWSNNPSSPDYVSLVSCDSSGALVPSILYPGDEQGWTNDTFVEGPWDLVPPNSEVKFRFVIRAPTVAGSYPVYFRMNHATAGPLDDWSGEHFVVEVTGSGCSCPCPGKLS